MDPKDNKYVRQAEEGEEHVKAPVIQWLRDSRAQCSAIDPKHDRLWIICGSAEGPVATKEQILRVRNTLFGMRSFRDPSRRDILACYGQPPAFRSYREIDALLALVDVGQGPPAVGILPNEFSSRFGALRSSKLALELMKLGSPFATADFHVRRGGCVIPDSIDRTDALAVAMYVEALLGVQDLKLIEALVPAPYRFSLSSVPAPVLLC